MSAAAAEPIADTTAIAPDAEVKPSEPVADAQATAEASEEPAQESSETAAAAPSARRSSRISAQPAKETAKPKKPAAPKNQRKRTVDEAQEEEGEGAEKNGTASKKTKTVVPDIPSIDIGDPLPTLTLKNEKDEDVDVSKLAAEKGVVVFLVPKADTPGCTTQACGFRDVYADFSGLGYDVYCLSADTTTAQSKWQSKKNLSYSLLSDPKRVFIAALGAAEKNKTKRSHFIFEKGTGKLVDKKNPVKPADSPTLALEFIKQHGSSPMEGTATTNEEASAAPKDANGHADAPATEVADAPPAEKAEAEPVPMET
ncbi:thioredoxin peroxidase dot5 [Marasmius crinis-equi]|uniref:thioredoxin-dependent peroxiredoxin n=1 Tax=Marasmius crinis-equi TaxID=585013 RepID=A0ABR3FAD3_9AGAR